MTSNINTNDTFLKEWETARDLLKSFDDRLHDLRKYGFSFITGLLAVEGWLSPKILLGDTTVLDAATRIQGIQPMVLVVVVVNLVLICAVRLIERNYEVFQIAAASRAMVLERVLNLELTEVISQRFNKRHVRIYVTWIYILFTLAVLALGWSALSSNVALKAATAVTCVLAALFIVCIGRTVRITYPNGLKDWTLERVECAQGEKVGITLTNLDEKNSLILGPGAFWKLETEDGQTQHERKLPPTGFTIDPLGSYTWLLETKELNEGIYRVSRNVGNNQWKPLRRRLRIKPREPGKAITPA